MLGGGTKIKPDLVDERLDGGVDEFPGSRTENSLGLRITELEK